jgi:SAM-dependent methyltransferase
MLELSDIVAKRRTEGCPSCGCKVCSFYIGSSAGQPSKLTDVWGNEGNPRFFFDFFKCRDCDLLFNKSYPVQSDLNTLYSLLPDNVVSGDTTCHEKTQNGYRDKIIRNLRKREGLSILEIGPDIGTLSKALIEALGIDRYVCVEPNTSMGNKLLAIKGVSEVYESVHDANSSEKGKFDLIVLVHVLDHLRDPLSDLKCATSMLRSGGMIFSVTHNYSSALRFLMGTKWPPFCMYHPHLFNVKSKRVLFHKAGLEQISFGRTSNYFPISFYLKNALDMIGIKFNLQIPGYISLPLGNIFMTGTKVHRTKSIGI